MGRELRVRRQLATLNFRPRFHGTASQLGLAVQRSDQLRLAERGDQVLLGRRNSSIRFIFMAVSVRQRI